MAKTTSIHAAALQSQDNDVLNQWGFSKFVESAINYGFFHELLTTAKPVGPTIEYANKSMVNFASINILNTHCEPDVLAHFHEASNEYGLTTGGSRVTQGVCEAHLCVENKLCDITGKGRALSFASGLLANVGFVNAMSSQFNFSSSCGVNNRDTVFILDRDSHWSLWKATSHLPFGQQVFAFKHNNPIDLNRILAKVSKQGRKIVVVFESVYSSDGSIAPIGKLLDICEQYGALSYIDDANGFMIYGNDNRPFYDEFRHLNRATFIMVSFSKSIGLEGGAIAGPTDFIHAFEVLSGTSMFTAAIQPPTASTIHYIMGKLQDNPAIMDRYLKKCADLRESLQEIGCKLNDTPSYITSVMIGEDAKAVSVWKECFDHGFIVPMFRYPAVKPNQALIRLMLNNHHTEEQIHSLLVLLKELKNRYKF
jgi:8-amino-7-oxononanoate synthase